MPELPDVEGFRRSLARHAEGQRIVSVHVPDRQIVRNRSPQALGRALSETRFASATRHGKWLIAPVDDGTAEVVLHFGMTGLLTWADDDRDRHDRLIFVCERGELRYNNMRRFGGVWLARDASEREQVTAPLAASAESYSPRGRSSVSAAPMTSSSAGSSATCAGIWRCAARV